MKVSERVSELVLKYTSVNYRSRDKLIEILEELNETVKNSLLSDSDIESIKRKQAGHREIRTLIEAIREEGADAFDLDTDKLQKYERLL